MLTKESEIFFRFILVVFLITFSANAWAEDEIQYIYESARGPFDKASVYTPVNKDQFIGAKFKLNRKVEVHTIGAYFDKMDMSMMPPQMQMQKNKHQFKNLHCLVLKIDGMSFPLKKKLSGSNNQNFDLRYSRSFVPELGKDFHIPVKGLVLEPGTYAVVFASGFMRPGGEHSLAVIQPHEPTYSSGQIISISNKEEWKLNEATPNRYRIFVTGKYLPGIDMKYLIFALLAAFIMASLIIVSRKKGKT